MGSRGEGSDSPVLGRPAARKVDASTPGRVSGDGPHRESEALLRHDASRRRCAALLEERDAIARACQPEPLCEGSPACALFDRGWTRLIGG